jgi:hypothetical protein
METENITNETEAGGEDRRALRMLLVGRTMRARKMRRLALTYLLREGNEAEDDDTEGDEEEGGGEERQALRMLIGGRTFKRRKLRRLALAHLLREGNETEDDEEGDEEEGGGEGGAEAEGGEQLARLRLDHVQRRAGLEPVDLLGVQRVPHRDPVLAAAGVVEHRGQIAAGGELREA